MRSVVRYTASLLIGVFASASVVGLEVDGVITIEFGATDRVVYTPGALPPQVDPITDLRDRTGRPKDAGKLDNDGNVIEFDQSGGTAVGFNDGKDWTGVFAGKKGVDAGRVGPGHALIMSLGSHFDGQSLAVLETVLGLTFKQDAIVDVVAENSDEILAQVIIRSGTSVVHNVGHPPPDAADPGAWNIDGANALIHNCNEGPDANPDSSTACMRQLFGVAGWTKLTMTTINSGTWSLGSGTSTLQLANIDGILDCHQTTITASDPSSEAEGFLRRMGNPDGTVCVAIPYSISLEEQELQFLADYQGQNAAFEVHVEWEPLNISSLRPGSPVVRIEDTGPPDDDGIPPDDTQLQTTMSRLPLSFQQFLPSDPEYYFDLCEGTPNYEDHPDGDTTEDPNDEIPLGGLIELAPPPGGFFDMSTLPGTQHGCLLKRSIKYIETEPDDGDVDLPDTIIIIEDGYVRGDWRLERG